ncbi:hypothetical protein BpHYR1_013428 [Brachionus plicatilis]|uniref:Uncharacterized protein n=1 Tax=Brachionus plicatilis TaxID=10195 RepID=A0A3M7Q8F6_BRAPC|nr:hypothetical protein BpHYR1_013428 [Brachionus plicatilis]
MLFSILFLFLNSCAFFEKITKSDSLLRLLFSTKLANVPAVRVLVVDWELSSNSEIFFCCSVIVNWRLLTRACSDLKAETSSVSELIKKQIKLNRQRLLFVDVDLE